MVSLMAHDLVSKESRMLMSLTFLTFPSVTSMPWVTSLEAASE